jgi:hypothetical protein
LDAGELARCAWATAVLSYEVAAAGPQQAHQWMHRTASHSRQRLTKFARECQSEIAARDLSDADAVLEQRLAEMDYIVERESATISACLAIVRHEDASIQSNLSAQRDALVEGLKRTARLEQDALRDFAGSGI